MATNILNGAQFLNIAFVLAKSKMYGVHTNCRLYLFISDCLSGVVISVPG
jgi:hypothetical protein